jgi:tetratricopeptide (TPR) repeat protein
MVLAPAPTPDIIAENEAFWNKADETALGRVAGAATPATGQSGLLDRLAQKAHLIVETNRDALSLGTFYSQALNFWGVQLQRQGQLAQAAAHFSRALELNPDNVVAQVNLECNRQLQAGQKTSVQISKEVEEKFGHRTWDQIMRDNGPFDEPTFCLAQANEFLGGGNNHQAAQQFERVRALEPGNLTARVNLAQIYYFSGLPNEAIQVINEIRSRGDNVAIDHTNAVQLLGIETAAHLANGDLRGAETAVREALTKSPRDVDLLAAATKVYIDFGCYTNALNTIEQQLQIRPDDPGALFYKGNACLQLNEFAQAIGPLTKVLEMETNNFSKAHYLAQFMRAKAYLGMEKLKEAKQDYVMLSKALPSEFPVYFDLGDIAYREKDTNAAIQYYQLYLANAPTNVDKDIKTVNTRLEELKRGSR